MSRHRHTGSILPSQRFLVGKMIAPIPSQYDGHILELGAGTGAITSPLAEKCPRARITACELNPVLAEDTRQRLHTEGTGGRVNVVTERAEKLLADLTRRDAKKPGYVISGIPLANLTREVVAELTEAIWRVLADDGMYIQFQYSLIDRKTIQSRFPRLRTVPVWLNIPPAVIYYAPR